MIILALDTSSVTVSVAVLSDDTVLAYREQTMARGHGEVLVPMIQQVLSDAGTDVSCLDGVAVAVGPGSFTGVRVGLSTARGIGLALNIPVYGVTNFESAVYGVSNPVVAVLDTKRGDYFVQCFDKNGKAGEATTRSTEEMTALLPFIAVGDGAERLSADIGCDVVHNHIPSAVAVGKIAFTKQGNALPAEPLYLRDADVTV